MSGLYITDMLDVLRAAGCAVAESSTTDGWQHRSRSSGGFPALPVCVFWHHTASSTSPANDLSYMIDGSDDAPVGNVLLDRTGTYWPIAAGASNCAGKGGPSSFSRGDVPQDSGNTYGFQIEVANDGVGEPWPQAQIDAYFAGSIALSARFGNLPTDIIGHAHYTSRKVDPATAIAVAGPWQPRSINSSGTWNLDDMRSECARRAAGAPDPGPDPEPVPNPKDDDMPLHVVVLDADGVTPTRGPAIVGPGYWHYSRNADEAFVWQKVWGAPLALDNDYDFDTLVRTVALEPDDDRVLGPGA